MASRLAIQDGIRWLEHTRDNPWRWWQGAYERTYTNFMAAAGTALARQREAEHGAFLPQWLPHVRLDGRHGPILTQDGGALTSRALWRLGRGTRLGDFVRWEWCAHGVVRFWPCQLTFPYSNAQVLDFKLLCNTLVANFPALVHRPRAHGQLWVPNVPVAEGYEWHLRDGVLISTVHGHTDWSRPVATQSQLAQVPPVKLAEQWVRPRLECGPELTKLVQVWGGQEPWRPHKRAIRSQLFAAERAAGLAALQRREARWRDDDEELASALSQRTWPLAKGTAGISEYDRHLWHRVQLHQLQSWSSLTQSTLCPFTDCTSPTDSGTGHIIWRCTRAQLLWRRIFELWKAVPQTETERLRSVFTEQPPLSAHNWSAMLAGECKQHGEGDVLTRLAHWLRVAWRQLTTTVLRRLWLQHTRGAHEELPSQERPQSVDADLFATLTMWGEQLRTTVASIVHMDVGSRTLDLAIQRQLCARFVSAPSELVCHDLTGPDYLLFFDGGSRGNPGPGGSGAVIVQVGATTATSKVVWVGSVFYRDRSTTNNQAEYRGLCDGLAAAVAAGWRRLTVVGDSLMIITQMKRGCPPLSRKLYPLFRAARVFAAKLAIQDWVHHYRDFNKMADLAANIAMDTCVSSRGPAEVERSVLAELQLWLTNDVLHWMERPMRSFFPEPD